MFLEPSPPEVIVLESVQLDSVTDIQRRANDAMRSIIDCDLARVPLPSFICELNPAEPKS